MAKFLLFMVVTLHLTLMMWWLNTIHLLKKIT